MSESKRGLTLLLAAFAASIGYFGGRVTRDTAPPAPPAAPASQPAREPIPEAAPRLSPHAFEPPGLERMTAAMLHYHELSSALAADRLDTLAPAAEALLASIDGLDRSGLPTDIQAALGDLQAAARGMQRASTLDEARRQLAAIGRLLVGLAVADPRLQEGWQLYRCPMVSGFAKWLQRPGPMANPYMGQRMLACGSESPWDEDLSAQGPSAVSTPPSGDAREIAHYTCPMHPSIHSQAPGACPICGMDLVPVTKAELASGEVRIDESRRQKIGVKLGRVERRILRKTVTASGRLTYDETRLSEVSLRQRGWVVKLMASATGQPVRRGDVLFTLYSPELSSAMKEFQVVLGRDDGSERSRGLVKSAEQRLRAWDLGETELARLRAGTLPIEAVPVRAKADGVIVEKNLVEGAAFEAGTRLFRIASLDPIWVEVEVYEGDLPLLSVGQEAALEVTHLPGETLRGRVSYVYPYLDPMTRTARARIELANPAGTLRPEMYATVRLEASLGERLAIPVSAVIYTGPRRLVFLDLGEGRFRPVEVRLGARAGQYQEVLSGLSEGQAIVTSGNFLIAAESRLRSAMEYWSEPSSEGAHHAH